MRAAQSETDGSPTTRDDLAAQVAQVQARVAATDGDVAQVLDELGAVADPAGQTA